MATILRIILTYYRTLPTAATTQFFLVSCPLWAIATYTFLKGTGFFDLQTYPFTLSRLLIGLVVYWVVPSALEESLYRPLFFPRPLSLYSWAFLWRMVVSTAVFVVSHPLVAYGFRPQDLMVFGDWRFLTAVAMLGIYCSILLVKTRTIYFGIVTHYMLVVSWRFIFCGEYLPSTS